MAHFHLNVMLRDKEAHQGALPSQLSHRLDGGKSTLAAGRPQVALPSQLSYRLDGGQSIWLLACPKKLSP